MQYKTFGELKLKVQRETDTEAEEFVTSEEIKSYFQDAVNECAAHIHKLGLEDTYFQSRKKYDIVIGQQELELPPDIYAMKISALTFSGNGKVFPIKRMKGPKRFSIIAEMEQFQENGDWYEYHILNTSPDTPPVIELWPPSKDQGANFITMYYIRQAIQIVDDSSKVDIPEFYSFIISFVKWKIYSKEGSALTSDAKAELDEKRDLMLATLAEITPDYDSNIEGDRSAYEEHT